MVELYRCLWAAGPIEREIRKRAIEALRQSDLDEIMELLGAAESRGDEASAALKAILAERIVEYTMKARDEAKKRKMPMGAAAILIASR